MQLVDPGRPDQLCARTASRFREAYGSDAEVVALAPGRVNLIGEHTDYNAGLCLPVALPHATYAAVARRSDDRFRITSVQADDAWEGGQADAGPGQVSGWPAYAAGVLWALGQDGHDLPGLDVLVDSTVPVGAGLSSSAALECAVGTAALDLLGDPLGPESRARLVRQCMRAETDVAGAPTGGLDQTISCFAVPGSALLLDFDDHSRRPVPLDLADAGLTLLVVDTTVSHALIDGGYAARRDDCLRAAQLLGVPTLRQATAKAVEALRDDRLRRRARHVVTEIQRVRETVTAVEAHDWAAVGALFDASHLSMRDDYEISCQELDAVVATATGAGAVAARMTGGGFGGSAVAVVPHGRLEEVGDALVAAFATRGYARPRLLRAEPSGPARPC